MDYKLIAMDFDDTLLNDEKRVTEKTKNTLMECKKNGYKIVGVTARSFESAKEVVPIEMFDFLILNNGAYLYDVEKHYGDYMGIIDKKQALEITRSLEKKSHQIDFVSGNMYYIYLNKKNSNLSFIKDTDSIDDIKEPIARMNIFLEDQKDVEYYYNLISNKYDGVNCFIMQDSKKDSRWIVINPKGLDKGVTLKLLGERLNLSTSEMIFFGDGLNDIEIMNVVGCSVAMENALDVIKNKASYITTSNNNDGIAVFLEKHLIKK